MSQSDCTHRCAQVGTPAQSIHLSGGQSSFCAPRRKGAPCQATGFSDKVSRPALPGSSAALRNLMVSSLSLLSPRLPKLWLRHSNHNLLLCLVIDLPLPCNLGLVLICPGTKYRQEETGRQTCYRLSLGREAVVTELLGACKSARVGTGTYTVVLYLVVLCMW